MAEEVLSIVVNTAIGTVPPGAWAGLVVAMSMAMTAKDILISIDFFIISSTLGLLHGGHPSLSSRLWSKLRDSRWIHWAWWIGLSWSWLSLWPLWLGWWLWIEVVIGLSHGDGSTGGSSSTLESSPELSSLLSDSAPELLGWSA